MTSREFNQDTGAAKRAAQDGPVYITDRGKPAHVLMTFDDYKMLADDGKTILDLLSATPGIGDIEFEIPKDRSLPKPATFD
jgi:prevent-host-death family protein